MSCITEATGGAGSYTIAQFFSYNETTATLVVVVACLLLPLTLYLGRKQQQLLKATPVSGPGAAQIKEWYSNLAYFPSVAAVGCWLSICLPNLGILFEVCYEFFEAICLTRFAFILLVLINGGVRVLDRYLETPSVSSNSMDKEPMVAGTRVIGGVMEMLSIYYPMLRTQSFIAATQKSMELGEEEGRRSRSGSLALLDVNEKGEERAPHPIGKVLVFVYQFVILGPLFVLLDLVCSYSGSEQGEAAAQIFNFMKLISTMVAMITLVSLVCDNWSTLPEGSNIHGKLITIKLMVLFGTLQGIIIALLIQCTPNRKHTGTFPPAIAAQTWQSVVFLCELPLLQLQFNRAYPCSDFDLLFGSNKEDVSFFNPSEQAAAAKEEDKGANRMHSPNVDPSPLLNE